jgi:methylenetetrahydrofolate dehydrogenase (NADP+)/methenyltetrahydrofolate cyclohydrolase
MELLYGKPVAERVLAEVARLRARTSVSPRLVIYQVGDDPASLIYARSKVKRGETLGARVEVRHFSSDVDRAEVVRQLQKDSADRDVTGIVIERPLPDGWARWEMMDMVPPSKDLEAQSGVNLGLMVQGCPRFIPPTPLGSILLMHHYGIYPMGKNIVIMGRSPTVGYPLALLLSQKRDWANATISMVHSATADPDPLLLAADIVITAIGRPGYLKGEKLKEGSTVVDVGINAGPDGKVVGDADMDSMEGVVRRATPTPGGTGSVTVACMFLNLFRALHLQGGECPRHEDDIIRMIYPPSE